MWFSIVKKQSLSKLFIIKFSEPVFACIFGALLLNENILRWQYALAFVLISGGIVLGHLSERKNRLTNTKIMRNSSRIEKAI